MSEDKQEIIYKAAIDRGQITKTEAVQLLRRHYYCNAENHVQQVLGRMVKQRLLKRIKRGVYAAANPNRRTVKPPIVNPDQTDLFQ